MSRDDGPDAPASDMDPAPLFPGLQRFLAGGEDIYAREGTSDRPEGHTPPPLPPPPPPPPSASALEIKDHLDKYVVGQEAAKRALAVLFSLHLGAARRSLVAHDSRHAHLRPSAPNALLVGPTGVGKTHTINIAAEFLRLPVVIVDSTTLVPAGAPEGSGQQLDSVMNDLIEVAQDMSVDGSDPVRLAQHGVVFLDEFDKLTAERAEAGGVAEYGHWYRNIQRRLLKFIEGSRSAEGLDSSNVLFVASGAFSGIDAADIVAKRPSALAMQDSTTKGVLSADVVSYGFIPELVARLPVLVQFQPLSREDLLGIMTFDAVDPMRLWDEHFAEQRKSIRLSDQAKLMVAGRAFDLGMGARGVAQVLYSVLFPLAFRLEEADPGVYDINEDLMRTLMRGI